MYRETRKHVLKCLEKGIRYDGRGLTDIRDVTVEYDVSKSAEGSARVKIGTTEVIAGVKTGVETPYADTPNQGNLMVNVELLGLASPDFEPGPPSIEAIEIARVVDRGIREAKAIDVKDLVIVAGEKVWAVIIDVCVINDHGNLIDACALAAMAALKDAKFPAYDLEKHELDYKTKTDKPIPLSKQPIAVTVYKIGDYLLVDPNPDESKVYDGRLTVTCSEKGSISSLQKGGEAPLTIEEIDRMAEIALEKCKELRSFL